MVGLVVLALSGLGHWLFQEPVVVVGSAASQVRRDVVSAAGSASLSPSVGPSTLRGLDTSSVKAEFEVCGLGRFTADEDEDAIRLAHAPAIAHAKEANLQALLHSSDVATQAAGMVFRIAEAKVLAYSGISQAEERCRSQSKSNDEQSGSPACGNSDSIALHRHAQQTRATLPWVEKLARLSTGSKSPAVVAQAVHACTGLTDLPACNGVNAAHWARLEPRNLVPWSLVLNQARSRKDVAAVNEALHQMSLAQYALGYDLFAWSQLVAGSPSAATDLQRMVSIEQGLSLYALPSDHASGLHAECSKSAVLDANRRQLCEKSANVLAEHSDTLISAAYGIAIGRTSGWSLARVATLRAQRRAIQQSHEDWSKADATTDGRMKMDCRAVQNRRSYIRKVGELGEVAALIALPNASNQTIQRLSQSYFLEELKRLEQEN